MKKLKLLNPKEIDDICYDPYIDRGSVFRAWHLIETDLFLLFQMKFISNHVLYEWLWYKINKNVEIISTLDKVFENKKCPIEILYCLDELKNIKKETLDSLQN